MAQSTDVTITSHALSAELDESMRRVTEALVMTALTPGLSVELEIPEGVLLTIWRYARNIAACRASPCRRQIERRAFTFESPHLGDHRRHRDALLADRADHRVVDVDYGLGHRFSGRGPRSWRG